MDFSARKCLKAVFMGRGFYRMGKKSCGKPKGGSNAARQTASKDILFHYIQAL
jgi:hypothetical protein